MHNVVHFLHLCVFLCLMMVDLNLLQRGCRDTWDQEETRIAWPVAMLPVYRIPKTQPLRACSLSARCDRRLVCIRGE